MYGLTISQELENYIYAIGEMFDIRVRNDYSGRYMYGDKCIALEFNGTAGQLFAAFLTPMTSYNIELIEPLAELFSEMRVDQLGKGYIYYFPGWSLDKE